MFLTKPELIEILIGFVEGDEECIQRITNAYTKENPIWDEGEWIYIKDIEMSLKSIFKSYRGCGLEEFESVKKYILSEDDISSLISDSWIKERIMDCRKNLDNLEVNMSYLDSHS